MYLNLTLCQDWTVSLNPRGKTSETIFQNVLYGGEGNTSESDTRLSNNINGIE